ncbi:hit family protein 1 [Moniliophthora roreri MCA 2997]|uniref:Hit family protein 1 n=1 Tax=Moniliophthora roreri (strain MCA 2997) TaxID=1381753 RepID=V2XA28_MONRO|nr:hit family protein 1 [Moniliophthora roreri MCA 2997]
MVANESETCIFCGILKGTIPCHKIYETEHSFAFLDIMPTTEGHTQVIPKYHAETLADLPDEYLRDIGPVAYNIVQNNGKLAFQHIPHVHFHVIPKPNETEGLILTVGQNWPQKKVDNDVLAVTCEKIKGRL